MICCGALYPPIRPATSYATFRGLRDVGALETQKRRLRALLGWRVSWRRRRGVASKAEIAKLLAILAMAFPSFRERAETRWAEMVNAYHLILGDLDADGLMKAAILLGRTQTFFPSAGELARAYYGLRDLAKGVPTAQEAWYEVKRLFRKGYSRLKVPTVEDVSHPRIWKALEGIGGWLVLCNSENDVADRARYLQAYEVYTERDEQVERMHPDVREMIERLSEELKLGKGNVPPLALQQGGEDGKDG